MEHQTRRTTNGSRFGFFAAGETEETEKGKLTKLNFCYLNIN